MNNLALQKMKHYATFQSIINGNQNEITVLAIRDIFH